MLLPPMLCLLNCLWHHCRHCHPVRDPPPQIEPTPQEPPAHAIMCSLPGPPGAMELGTSQSHPCSLVLVPVGATCRLSPMGDQAADSSTSLLPQLEAPCPSVLMPVQVPVATLSPSSSSSHRRESTPHHHQHPGPARKAEPALCKPGPAGKPAASATCPRSPKPSLGGAQPSSQRNAAPRACRANEKRMGPTSGSD